MEVLTISGVGINPFSVRGIEQSYAPIDERSQNVRTINGMLIDVGDDAFNKLVTTIACEDMQSPLFDGIYPGKEVVIECVADLGYDTATGQSATRPIVTGSQRQQGSSTIWLYKPILTCLIDEIETDAELWGKVYAWTLVASEK